MQDIEVDSPGSANDAPAPSHDPLLASPLFDAAYYAQASGLSGTRAELLDHYLQTGEAQGLSPSAEFDVRLYAILNPDVAQSGGSLLRHYAAYGHAERRYATRAALAADAETIEASGLFDTAVFAKHYGALPRAGLSLIEAYLAARDGNAPTGEAFEGAFYQTAYPDVRDYPALPILHFIRVGQAERRLATAYDLQHRTDVCRASFREDYYRTQLPPGEQPDDALRHYILFGARRGLDPAPDFSNDYYQRLYPDMAAGTLDPFFHYVHWGRAEGRVGRPDFSAARSRGGRAFDLYKPTILVTSHEASRTGAPLVALSAGAWLADTYNVITYLGRGGTVAADFAAHSVLVVTCSLSPLDAEYLLRELRVTHSLAAVLLNSAETSPLGPAALHAGVPCVALVHEFAAYTLPPGRMSSLVESADRVVTPAALIRDSLQRELAQLRGGPANHVVVRPQGCLPALPQDLDTTDLSRADLLSFLRAEPGRTKVVLAAGYVQMRKGLDLFVQTAAEFRAIAGDDVRFLWVGSGYHPAADMAYGVFVADMIRRLDLEGTVLFLPNQSSLDAVFAVADVFYLPSRLDPFPNVVLDAFRAGKPVVCFDRATGVAEAMRDQPAGADRKAPAPRAVGAAVPFCDVRAAAAALANLCRPAEMKRAAGNAAFATQHFHFDGYMNALMLLLDEARAAREAADSLVAQVEADGLFDTAFHDGAAVGPGTDAQRRAIRAYVARGQKGLAYASPRPGFNEAAAGAASGRPGPALLRGPDGALPAPTHRCVILRGAAPPFAGRVGLHLHLHYADLAPLFAAKLQEARCTADLVVTTTADTQRIEIEYAFRAHRGAVRVLAVPNRGRDIGPFLSEAGRLLREGYDVIGHLHGKRSVEAGAGVGDRWRGYLLANLLGLDAGGMDAVLAPFTDDPRLGLLFAEDRHCVGWTDNLPAAQALAARMDPQPVLPAAPIFPLGTMFWARPAALTPLWALKLAPADFPPEPLPYDGTVLHALERMLPAVCDAAGYGWCTVHKPGTGW